jgi:hypothetical protein
MKQSLPVLLLPLLFCCSSSQRKNPVTGTVVTQQPAAVSIPANKNKVIHIMVALCDNRYQGIVPVPARIGNGQDAASNLYWGAGFGVKTWYAKQKAWRLVHTTQDTGRHILERCVFWNAAQKTWLVADAYDGQYIQPCTVNFLKASAGQTADSVTLKNETIYCAGSAALLGYIGHDGLMDFRLTETCKAADSKKRETIILACYSRSYFSPHLRPTSAQPLLWSNGLMSPEAYTLDAAISAWLTGQPATVVHEKAAAAYHQYQHCGIKAARKLLTAGW